MRPDFFSMLPWRPLAPQPTTKHMWLRPPLWATCNTPHSIHQNPPSACQTQHQYLVDIFSQTWPCFPKFWMSSVSFWRGLHTLNLFSCDGHVETIAFKVTIALPFSPAGTAGSDLRKSKEKLAEENREKVSKDKWSVQKDRRRVNCDWRQDSWEEAGRV